MARDELTWGSLLGIGLTTAVVFVVGLALGWLVDHLLGTSPIFIFLGLLLGIVGAAAYIIAKFRTYLKN